MLNFGYIELLTLILLLPTDTIVANKIGISSTLPNCSDYFCTEPLLGTMESKDCICSDSYIESDFIETTQS